MNSPPPPTSTHSHTQRERDDENDDNALTRPRDEHTMDLRQVDPSHDDSKSFACYGYRLKAPSETTTQMRRRRRRRRHEIRETTTTTKCKVTAPPQQLNCAAVPSLWFASLALLNLAPTIALAFGKLEVVSSHLTQMICIDFSVLEITRKFALRRRRRSSLV